MLIKREAAGSSLKIKIKYKRKFSSSRKLEKRKWNETMLAGGRLSDTTPQLLNSSSPRIVKSEHWTWESRRKLYIVYVQIYVITLDESLHKEDNEKWRNLFLLFFQAHKFVLHRIRISQALQLFLSISAILKWCIKQFKVIRLPAFGALIVGIKF